MILRGMSAPWKKNKRGQVYRMHVYIYNAQGGRGSRENTCAMEEEEERTVPPSLPTALHRHIEPYSTSIRAPSSILATELSRAEELWRARVIRDKSLLAFCA